MLSIESTVLLILFSRTFSACEASTESTGKIWSWKLMGAVGLSKGLNIRSNTVHYMPNVFKGLLSHVVAIQVVKLQNTLRCNKPAQII